MNVKTIVQLLIFIVIIFFLYFFIKNTFFIDDVKVANIDLEDKEINALEIDNSEKENEQSNIIKNLYYKSIDEKGNEYVLKAESGEKADNKNFLKLYKVKAEIKLINKSIILINSEERLVCFISLAIFRLRLTFQIDKLVSLFVERLSQKIIREQILIIKDTFACACVGVKGSVKNMRVCSVNQIFLREGV